MVRIWGTPPTLGERIKLLRKKIGLSQAEFAKRLGIKRAHISRIESGHASPSELLLRVIGHEYAVYPDWLINGNGRMEINTEEFMDQELEIGLEMFRTKLRIFQMFVSNPVSGIVDSLELCANAAKEGTLKPLPPDILKLLLQIKSCGLDRIMAAIDDIVSGTKLE